MAKGERIELQSLQDHLGHIGTVVQAPDSVIDKSRVTMMEE